jgi:hypothetical protein
MVFEMGGTRNGNFLEMEQVSNWSQSEIRANRKLEPVGNWSQSETGASWKWELFTQNGAVGMWFTRMEQVGKGILHWIWGKS